MLYIITKAASASTYLAPFVPCPVGFKAGCWAPGLAPSAIHTPETFIALAESIKALAPPPTPKNVFEEHVTRIHTDIVQQEVSASKKPINGHTAHFSLTCSGILGAVGLHPHSLILRSPACTGRSLTNSCPAHCTYE